MKEIMKDENWASISDLMAGLMIIFMFIAISFMSKITQEKKAISDIADTYIKVKSNLYDELEKEFVNDLDNWEAEIDRKTLSVKFNSPKVLFKQGTIENGGAELKPEFKKILDDFFPRFINILKSNEFNSYVEEIRIEGHTDSSWFGAETKIAYMKNMELSQARTRSVLEYTLTLVDSKEEENWLIDKVTANGLSFSKLVKSATGKEDEDKSRRVEFRIRTNAEEQIEKIIKTGENKNEVN